MKIFQRLQTVRAKLTLWNVFVLAIVLVAFGGILREAMAHNLMASIDGELGSKVKHHQSFWRHVPAMRDRTPGPGPSQFGPPNRGGRQEASRRPRGNVPRPSWPRQTFAPPAANDRAANSQWRAPVIERVFERSGKQSFPPGENAAPWAPSAFALASSGRDSYSTVTDEGVPVRVVSAPLRNSAGEIAAVVQVGASLVDVDRSIANMNSALLALTPIALLVAASGGLFLTGKMLRPLREMNQTVSHIGAGDLSQRLAVTGQDEFSSLAANFNQMLERLEVAFEKERRFVADASHELRTPLTVIKLHSSRSLTAADLSEKQRRAWGATDRAANIMNAIVQDLMLLARSDAGRLDLALRPVSLRDSIESAIEVVQAEGTAKIDNFVPAELMADGDMHLLTRAFTNVLKNALRHTPVQGHITVAAEKSEGAVTVIISDTGTGIAAEHLPHIMDRFYRVDEARTRADGGTGLGLAITRSIVDAHGGKLEISSVVGEGTVVRITLSPGSSTTLYGSAPDPSRELAAV